MSFATYGIQALVDQWEEKGLLPKKKIMTHILKKNVKENESFILIKDNIMLEFI